MSETAIIGMVTTAIGSMGSALVTMWWYERDLTKKLTDKAEECGVEKLKLLQDTDSRHRQEMNDLQLKHDALQSRYIEDVRALMKEQIETTNTVHATLRAAVSRLEKDSPGGH